MSIDREALEQHIGMVRDGHADDECLQALSAELEESIEARRIYLEQTFLAAMLEEELADAQITIPEPPKSFRAPLIVILMITAIAAAIVLALVVKEPPPPSATDPAIATDPAPLPLHQSPPARLAGTSDAIWRYEQKFTTGDTLPIGQILSLTSGQVAIELNPDTRLVFAEASSFEIIDSQHIRLLTGKMGAWIRGKNQIQVDTPGATIRDIGTEFGIQVSDGITFAHVFEGAIEARMTDYKDASIIVKAGSSALINPAKGDLLRTTQVPEDFIRASEIQSRMILDNSSYADRVLADGASHYWNFDGSTEQQMTSGTLSAQEFSLSKPSKLKKISPNNTVLTFNPRKDENYAPANFTEPLANAVPYTVEFWYNQRPMNNGKQILLGRASNAATKDNHLLLVETIRASSEDAARIRVLVRNRTNEKGTEIISPGIVKSDQWHHIVVRRTENSLALFIDGKLSIESPLVRAKAKDRGKKEFLFVGHLSNVKTWSSSQRWFRGEIDEIAIYPTPLSDFDVRNHYQKGLPLFPGKTGK